METKFTILLSDLPKHKRHISSFNKEFTQVCTGINLEATCSNLSCESVHNFEGLVIIRCPGITSCVYQEMVNDLRCSSCGCVLPPEKVKGVVFVRCQAKINIGVESVAFRVRGEETVMWELPYQGHEVLITLLDRELDLKTDSKPFLYPGEGVNLSAVCRNNKCQASTTNNGLVVIRVGLLKSQTYQELLNNRHCPSCNHPLEARFFQGVIFNLCQGEVEIAGNVQRFNAHQNPKLCNIDLSSPMAIVRMRQDVTDVHSEPTGTPDKIKSNQEKPLSILKQILAQVMGKHLAITPGLNLLAKCSNFHCASNEKGIGVICIGKGSANTFQYKELILGQTCPSCHQPVPLTSFKGILFFQCKAKIVTFGEETEYLAGRIPEIFEVSSDGAEVEITVLETRAEITTSIKSPKTIKWSKGGLCSSESSQISFKRTCIGLNLKAMCSNPNCEASVVVFPCPNITECMYSSLLTGLACPGCQRGISPLYFIGITLVKCNAEVKIGNEKHIVTAEGDETVDIEVNLQGPEVYLSILKRHIFSSDEMSGGSGKVYMSSTTGLNGIVECENKDCLAFKENEGQVVINFQDVSTGVLREVAENMKCPACFQILCYSNLKAVVFVRCSGELQIGSDNESFNSVGTTTSQFRIFSGGPEVHFSICKTESFRKYLKPEKGLNLLAKCSNTSCPSQSQSSLEGIICLKMGEVTNCRLERLIQKRICPCCDHPLSPDGFICTGYTQCTARIKTSDFTISYLFGRSSEYIPIVKSKQPVIDILPVQKKDLSLEPTGSPYNQMKRGMNLRVLCTNLDCKTKKSSDGIIIISLQEMKVYHCKELYSTIKCPACQNTLPNMILSTLSFIHCRAEILVGKDRFVIEAVNGEAIDFKLDSTISDVTVHVMEEKADTSVLFPEIQSEGSTIKVGEFSYHSVCHGLNFIVLCSNPACESVKNSEPVVINSGHLLHCDLRPVMQLLNCCSCEERISPTQVKKVEFVCCSGEITINGKEEKFNPTGSITSRFEIPCDNSPVIMKVYNREYSIITNNVFSYKRRSCTKHNNGINFRCYCKNQSCTAVKDGNGLVVVQRNKPFVRKHGYCPSTCYYSQEISQLTCPSCGSHLKKYYVYGVGLVHCRGTITRYGSPAESFYPSTGDVLEYQLDAEDTSLKIEFSLTWSLLSFLM